MSKLKYFYNVIILDILISKLIEAVLRNLRPLERPHLKFNPFRCTTLLRWALYKTLSPFIWPFKHFVLPTYKLDNSLLGEKFNGQFDQHHN